MSIRAIIFDLDGTLVQTEQLKVDSFVHAVQELSPENFNAAVAAEIYKEFVGLPRQEVARGLLHRFNLEAAAQARAHQYGVETAWQVVIAIRHHHYSAQLANIPALQALAIPETIAVAAEARQLGRKTGLATMSTRRELTQVLQALNIHALFDVTASQDEITCGKPDPEIYLYVAHELNESPPDCLVIEDLLTGVQAALAAGMRCIAVPTGFTREALHTAHPLDDRWMLDDPQALSQAVRQLIC